MEHLKLKSYFAFNKTFVAFGKYKFQRKSILPIFFKLEFKNILKVIKIATVLICFNFSIPLLAQKNSKSLIQIHPKVGFVIDQDENKIFDFFDSTQFKNFNCAAFYKNSKDTYFAILNNSDTVFFRADEILRFSSQINQSTYIGNRNDESTSKCYLGIGSKKLSKLHSGAKSWEEDTKIRPYLDLSIMGIASMLDAPFFLLKTSLNTNYNDWNFLLGFSYAESNYNVTTYMNYEYDNIYYTDFHFCIGKIFTNDYFTLSTSIGPSMETYTFQKYKNVFFFFSQLEEEYTKKFVGIIFDSQIHFLAHSKLGPVIGLHLSYSEMGFIKGVTIGLRLGRILPPYKKY